MLLRTGAFMAPVRRTESACVSSSPGDGHRQVSRLGLGVTAALILLAHLLLMGGVHHAADPFQPPSAQALGTPAGAHQTDAPSAAEPLGRASDGAHSGGTDGAHGGGSDEHPESECGDSLRHRPGVATGIAPPATAVGASVIARVTADAPLIAIPAPPSTPDLVRELRVQRV